MDLPNTPGRHGDAHGDSAGTPWAGRTLTDEPLPSFLKPSDQTDGVVLVVEAGRTRVEDALDALRVLRAADAHVLGVVLNRAPAPSASRKPRPSSRRP